MTSSSVGVASTVATGAILGAALRLDVGLVDGSIDGRLVGFYKGAKSMRGGIFLLMRKAYTSPWTQINLPL